MPAQTRRTSAVTDVKGKAQNATPANVPAMPTAWGSEPIEQFSGHDLTDKSDLIGVPFLIIGAEIERNEGRDYDVAYVYALDVNGTEFEFSDTSSTGVRHQVQGLIAEKGGDPAPGAGFQKLRIACMKGLRISEFEIRDEDTGKKRMAGTYYLGAVGVQHS